MNAWETVTVVAGLIAQVSFHFVLEGFLTEELLLDDAYALLPLSVSQNPAQPAVAEAAALFLADYRTVSVHVFY